MYRSEMVDLAKEYLVGESSYKEYVLFPDGSKYFMVEIISGFVDCSNLEVLSKSCKWCAWLCAISVLRLKLGL